MRIQFSILIRGFQIFILLLLTFNALSQNTRQLKRLDKEADQLYQSEFWGEALGIYELLDSISPDNSEYQFRIGVIYYHTIDIENSLQYFQDAIRNGKKDLNLDYYIAKAYQFNLDFDSALHYYQRCLNLYDLVGQLDDNQRNDIENGISACQYGEEITNDPLETRINNFGPPVNTLYPEYVPLVSADERIIIFTSRRPNTTGRNQELRGQYMEDIYLSVKNPDGTWSEPDNNLPFNTKGHDACVGLNPEGTRLILYRSDNRGDLYISVFEDDKWSKPIPISNKVNTDHWESSACFSTDGNHLYFSSDKPGGYGGSDIYKATFNEYNGWGNIENLGPVINTPYDEDAPKIHSDNKTMFFSSKGHKSIGGYDIFSSVYDEVKKEWETPRNIGYPINTPGDDIYFSLSTNGEKGFFSSYRPDSHGEKDIYTIIRPDSVATKFIMQFKLFDHFHNRAITAGFKLTDPKTMTEYKPFSKDSVEGKYVYILDFNTKYIINIDAPGYKFDDKELEIDYRADIFEYVMNIEPNREEGIELVDSKALVRQSQTTLNNNEFNSNIILSGSATPVLIPIIPINDSFVTVSTVFADESETPDVIVYANMDTDILPNQQLFSKEQFASAIGNSEISSEIIEAMAEDGSEVIFLTRIDNKENVAIPSIQFEFDEFGLSDVSKSDLDNLADFLKKNRNLRAILGGHTDSIGWNSYNKDLSLYRAGGVRLYLKSKGVREDQLYVIALSEKVPILSNSSIMGRKINRRVGMTFIDINDPKYQNPPYDSILESINLKVQPERDYMTPYIVWEKMPVSIHFSKNNTSTLTDYSRRKLDQLINYLNMVPFRLIITGYMDPNDENSELNLAAERAGTVSKYLASHGVAEDKLMYIENENFNEYFDIWAVEPGISRRRVQFFLIKN